MHIATVMFGIPAWTWRSLHTWYVKVLPGLAHYQMWRFRNFVLYMDAPSNFFMVPLNQVCSMFDSCLPGWRTGLKSSGKGKERRMTTSFPTLGALAHTVVNSVPRVRVHASNKLLVLSVKKPYICCWSCRCWLRPSRERHPDVTQGHFYSQRCH